MRGRGKDYQNLLITTVGVIASTPSRVSPEISISRYFLYSGTFDPYKFEIISSIFFDILKTNN